MKESISINNQSVMVKEYEGKRVVTFKDIDTVHERPEGTARKRFNYNKKHFIEGEDYYQIQPSEIRTVGIKSPNGGIVVTESGYLMLVKSFNDDLAWAVQRQLVNTYFKQTEANIKAPVQQSYTPKYYKGEMVATIKDIESLSGVQYSIVWHHIKNYLALSTHYYKLEGRELVAFKTQFPSNNFRVKHMIIVNRKGLVKLSKSAHFKSLVKAFDNVLPNNNLTLYDNGHIDKKRQLDEISAYATSLNNIIDNMGSLNSQVDTSYIEQAISLLSTGISTSCNSLASNIIEETPLEVSIVESDIWDSVLENVYKVAESNNIDIISYSEASRKNLISNNAILKDESSFAMDRNDKVCIFYDSTMSKIRQSQFLSYELGNALMCSHKNQFDKPFNPRIIDLSLDDLRSWIFSSVTMALHAKVK